MTDREILRDLACRVRALAESPEMAERRRLWRDHNALRPTRPLLLVLPEGSWPEALPDSALQCQDPQFRDWERSLRQTLYTHQVLRDDQVLDSYFNLTWRVERGDYGVAVPYTHGDNRGSYVWDPPLKNLPADLDKLHFRRLSVDRAGTSQDLARARETFGDLLTPRIHGTPWWTVGLTWEAVKLIGLEQLMLLMCDDPASLHRLMAFLRDEMLHFITWFEQQGLLTPNNQADCVGSGGVGLTDQLHPAPDQPARLSQMWGFGESQETVGISPAMFEEFVLPYQVPLLAKFGLNYYGCCEQLEHRIDLVIQHVPRLRRVSVAPLAHQEILAEKLAGRYIYCRKADPVPVCVDFSEEHIRKDLRRTLAAARGQPLEIILKDTHTTQNQPWRLARWVEIAREEVEAHAPAARG